MSTFLVGTNRFDGCETLIAFRDNPVLRIDAADSVLSVHLHTPPGTANELWIEGNEVKRGSAGVVAAQNVLSVVHGLTAIVHAVVVDEGVVVSLDLRPLGVAIHTDAHGLHIGNSTLSGNHVQGPRVAIQLS
jgi:hypothetical protein